MIYPWGYNDILILFLICDLAMYVILWAAFFLFRFGEWVTINLPVVKVLRPSKTHFSNFWLESLCYESNNVGYGHCWMTSTSCFGFQDFRCPSEGWLGLWRVISDTGRWQEREQLCQRGPDCPHRQGAKGAAMMKSFEWPVCA